MTDDRAVDRIDPDERAWRRAVERAVRSDDDCSQRAARLRTTRAEFEPDRTRDERTYAKRAVPVVLVLAVPLILYSETIAPSGGINYMGMGTGLLLMAVAGLAHR